MYIREFSLVLLPNIPIFLVVLAFYRLKLHPLSKFPGPRLWAISRLPFIYHYLRGTLHYRVDEIHQKYGHVVRIAPGELSFTHEDTWSDAYFNYNGKQFSRDPALSPEMPDGGDHAIIFALNEADHARMRRVLAPGFSEASLRKQEPIISIYVDLLIQRLCENAGKPIDIWHWIKLAAFDITGDLTFGESFDCLVSSKEHDWITTTFVFIKAIVYSVAAARLKPLHKLLAFLVPKALKERARLHSEQTDAKLDRRLAKKEARPDFLTIAQATLDTPQGMSLGELRASSAIIIVAGSETSAMCLAGTLHLLLTNPSKLQTLTRQVRAAFVSEQDITIQHVRERLPFQFAVLKESLRLLPPVPVATSIYRVVPDEGAVIAGQHVPGKTVVAVTPWAAFRSARNFADPEAFVPERWLEGKECPERYREDKRKVAQAFGVGPRGCIGKALAYAEMGLILARIVWNFDLELCDGRAWGPERKSRVWGTWEHDPLMVRVVPVTR